MGLKWKTILKNKKAQQIKWQCKKDQQYFSASWHTKSTVYDFNSTLERGQGKINIAF